ncbi:MAG: hypothetical protein Q7T30_03380, partial [Planctomycetota bacterium]|nr:hypothetical protein [Planctomycetota bacterium]
MTRSVINQNFLVGVIFVIGGLILAAMAFISPILAAVMHVVGALLVVFNSFRLVRQGEELEPFVAEQGKPTAPGNAPAPPAPTATRAMQPGIA